MDIGKARVAQSCKRAAACMLLALPAARAMAAPIGRDAPERVLGMEEIVLEDIKVEGLVQAWKFRKVCLDGQTYLLVLGPGGPTSITASFKDGKPEQCKGGGR